MARRHRTFADAPLVSPDPEGGFDPALKVAAPPAHPPVARRIGPGPDPARELDPPIRREPPRPRRRPPVRQPRQALGVVAMPPAPQGLGAHPTARRRPSPADALQNRRDGQHPARRTRIRRPPRCRPQLPPAARSPRATSIAVIPASTASMRSEPESANPQEPPTSQPSQPPV